MPELRTEYWNRIQGLRNTNAHIRKAIDYFDNHYEETDEVIQRFIDESPLSNEEFITFIAIRRLEGLRRSSGNASSAMMDQIRREYKNTPWKFVEEFLQNADDCSYEGTPEITIVVDERNSAIEFAYNERGFTRKDIWSLTQFSDSTKPSDKDLTVNAHENGLFYNEKTGRKGIGFKSVFSLDAENVIVHINSNGFGFRLDNSISSIVPVWEQPKVNDGKTHIRIELINPNFSLQDIYPQFKEMFCVSNRARLFSDSPILFMHKLRNIRVEHQHNRSSESFAVSLRQDYTKTEYGNVIHERNGILSGISYNGKLCSSELARINLCFQENNGPRTDIPCLRYSETIKVNGYWNIFSVIGPIIRGENTWSGGALFRTFPMIDHNYPIPFAMNLPYELNMARKGISYSDAVAENKLVSEKMFKVGGVFRVFLSHLRSCIGITIDQYFPRSSAILFDDTNNRNRDSYYVPLVDLKEILACEEIFPLYIDEEKFVSYNNLVCVDEQFLDWPEPQKMLRLLLGNSFVDRLVAKKYLSCSLLQGKRTGLIDAQFVLHMNEYLQVLERNFGCSDGKLAEFFSKSFYPFLCSHEIEVRNCDGFKKLSMYLFDVFDGANIVTVRESYNPGDIWIDGAKKASYHHYRTIFSSKTDLSGLLQIKQPTSVHQVSDMFTLADIQRRAQNMQNIDAIVNEIEESTYFGGSLTGITFPALNRFALASDVCAEINPFRDAHLLGIINRKDSDRIANCFKCSINDVISVVRKLGLRTPDDFFEDIGTFWRFNDLSKAFIGQNNETLASDFLSLLEKRLNRGKKLDVSYSEIQNACLSIKLFMIRKTDYVVREAYDQLCSDVLNDGNVWHKKCNESTEILLRAVSKVTNTNIHSFEQISIDIKYLVENKLGSFAKRATEKFNFDKYLRINNRDFFEKISKQDVMDALMATELDDARKKEEAAKIFYRGDLSTCHSEGKPIDFLIDPLSNAVYLHGTEDHDFRETFIYKYLQCQFDAEKNKLLEQVRKQTRPVYDRVIRPMLNRTNDDWDTAFDLISQDFPRMSKEDIINIIARFRLQSYSESLGNASRSHETEITDDYRQEPWKFAYEFLQNTDDCTFPANVTPEIAVAVNLRNNSISFEYNEFGFRQDDINAITSFGNSQKSSDLAELKSLPLTGVFDREKTGRKGRGFKSVFALPGKDIIVHIVSNGYSFRFEKRLGEIIPIWEKPDSSSNMGTKITIEGFLDNSINTIYERLLDTLFVKDQRLLFASSPLLFMRNLRKFSLSDGMKTYRFELEEENAQYSQDVFQTNSVIVSGVRENGKYRSQQIATVIIHQYNATSTPIHVKALKVSYMKDVCGRARVISIMTPIVTNDDSGFQYTYGSLYRTLPLSNHRLPIPISINTAFNLNSGRSALTDEDNMLNKELNRLVFSDCLPKVFNLLRTISGIAIETYIPNRQNGHNVLYRGMMHVQQIDVRGIIRQLPILKLYSQNGFISCNEASVLSSECYAWPLPVQLTQIFEERPKDRLVLEEYRKKIDELHNTQIVNNRFCNHINQYLDRIEANPNESVWPFLSDKLYPFISKEYEEINRAYIGDEDSLRSMKVFAYTDVNDQRHRESGNVGSIWLINCPSRYKSYINCRVFESAPVHYNISRDHWIADLLNAIEYSEFQAGYGYASDIWESAIQWLKIGLYYDRRSASKLSYLRNCVLCESLDPEHNIFRTAFSHTSNKDILSRIITEQDVDGILRELTMVTSTVKKEDIVSAIQHRGLRKCNEFFDYDKETIRLTKPTLAVFRSSGYSRELAAEYVNTVVQAFDIRYGKNAMLSVSFAELKDCTPVLFTCIFRYGLLTGDMRSRIAKCFFEQIEPAQADKITDYTETYLFCMGCVQDKPEISRNLRIPLSEIIKRKLGECVQHAHFSKYCAGSTLTITRDIKCSAYESREIKKSLHWLSEGEDTENEITRIAYFTADISDAFIKSETSQYICDSSSVIVSARNPQEPILDYVKHKYTSAGNKELLVGLIRIASIQYELQDNWKGTKKEFVEKLAAFRSETDKYVNFLCPGYQRGINQATGDTTGSLLPELLQNINDCRFSNSGNKRSLLVALNQQAQTMTLSYDELGFQYADVYSITAYGQSTKHDEREGEKGLGFKKVFTVFSQVDIYSNGFSFTLTKQKPTIPQWIEQSPANQQYMQSGKTTMVFKFAQPELTMQRINSIWTDSVRESDSAGLLLGLRNISEFDYSTGTIHQHVTRDQLLSRFYFKELPLLGIYKQFHNTSYDILQEIKKNLRTRTKCTVMSDAEFDSYLNQLVVSVYMPKKPNNDGTFYSTLPTAQKTGCSIHVDLPLELSTGRNEIMHDSAFNNTIMRMLYYPDSARYSIIGYALASIAKDNPDCRVYDYFQNMDAYISAVAGDNLEGQEIIKSELRNIPIVHTYEQNSLVSVGQIYTAQKIVYDYMHDVKENITRYDVWLRNHHLESIPNGCYLASYQDGTRRTLNTYATNVGGNSFCFPLCGQNNELTIQYFEAEYGTEGGV